MLFGSKDYSISEYLENITQVINSVKKTYSNLKKIILVVHSIGGMVAIIYASMHKEISGVVSIMPPQTYFREENSKRDAEWAKEKYRLSERHLPWDETKVIQFNVPYSFAEDAKKYSALESVSKVKVPLFLIAGGQDTLIPPESIKEIYNKANQPKEFILLKEVGHDFRKNKKETEIVNATIKEIVQRQMKSKI